MEITDLDQSVRGLEELEEQLYNSKELGASVSADTVHFKLKYWFERLKEEMKPLVLLQIKKKGTIKIMVGQGIVQSVEGLPDGYQYEVIECDKYGNRLCPECHDSMELADEDVEGQGKEWLCQNCKVHIPENCEGCTIPEPEEKECTDCDVPIKEAEKKSIPPARCGICGGIVTKDNFSESQGVLTHQECPEPDYEAMEAEAQAERDAETDYQNEMGG